jgi:hypothetical protein
MHPLPTSDEYLNVDLDWDFDAVTSDCENDIEFSSVLPSRFTKETVAPPCQCQSPSDVHSVKTVSDTSSTDQSSCSTSETSLESLDQALHKEQRPKPVKKTRKRAVTTRRSGWKKPKDAPKRYVSAYNFFVKQERQRIRTRSDGKNNFTGLSKIIGQRWNCLTAKQREPYEIMTEKDIGRYREEMKTYEDARRRKYYRSPSSVTTASTLSDDTRCPSPDRISPDRHPVLESVKRQHQYAHYLPPPTVYAPQVITPDQHHNGPYNAGGQYVGQQQQYTYPQSQVQYACYRMTRQEAQDYMRRYQYAGEQQHHAQSI